MPARPRQLRVYAVIATLALAACANKEMREAEAIRRDDTRGAASSPAGPTKSGPPEVTAEELRREYDRTHPPAPRPRAIPGKLTVESLLTGETHPSKQ